MRRGDAAVPRFVLYELALSCVLAAVLTADAAAQPADVDLELVLAVDVSRSMDFEEQRLQRDGYVAAFRHPEVQAAIASGPLGRIAVTYLEWGGPTSQRVIVPWTIVAGSEDAIAFAGLLDQGEMLPERGTSISSSLYFAAGLFESSGVRGLRQAIDVSGDGPNNMGPPVVPVRDGLIEKGITINGLPIMLRPGGGFGPYSIPNLDVYYEDCVIGGPGAFMVTVDDVAQFPEAIRRKLVLEIAGVEPEPELIPAALASVARVDCLIGEKSRGRWITP
jgi:hypothetical protein